eukprot:COSAG02_NODE_7119_length_3174_cov_2.783740_3_plen_150_part_00
MQVYLAESFLVYDGSLLQDPLTEDHASNAAAFSATERAYGLGDNSPVAEVCPRNDVAAASTSDEHGHQPQDMLGSTPVREQGPGLLAGVGGGSSGTPLSHGSALPSTAPLADSLQLSGEAFSLSITLGITCLGITGQAQPRSHECYAHL